MRKHLFFATLALLALTSCSSDNELTVDNNVPSPIETAQSQVPIAFGTYIGQSANTRATMIEATKTSITTDAQLKASTGFGVFAYSTGTSTYPTNTTSAAPAFTPNLMYNERVMWTTNAENSTQAAADVSGAYWGYWPLKFWPNDNQPADTQGAGGSVTNSYVSFFAYAPYTGQDDGDGTLTTDGSRTGITGISENTYAGDPTISYALDPNGQNVDLLWGTCNSTYNKASSTSETQTGGKVAYKTSETENVTGEANVNINLVKPWVANNSTTSKDKITFHFRHALAQVGGSLKAADYTTPPASQYGLQVKLDIDNNGNITGGVKPGDTKVTIKTITIENSGTEDMDGSEGITDNDKIVKDGTFNLALGKWTKGGTALALKHVIKSPATQTSGEGAEAAATAPDLRTSLAEPASVTTWDGLSSVDGVTTNAQNVYKEECSPLVFIPGTKPIFKVTVEYIVRTKDAKISGGYSEVTQKISKIVKFTNDVEINKMYSIIMRLGLTSIKFEATVNDWNDANGDGSIEDGEKPVDIDVHVPQNVSGS